ncbi:glutamate 5-kinase [Sphingobacterium pedocola]|uniref:Glutamate 5-kinase n=1 Tax=Sphingobacterium pedocola TaxID=2082722 RepID=A0ABR9T251_9SPHI|nr:glutamate 5-kinase [Sphingobacterium pedocola]MBE8719414.1 glutamate 5-kinase [Sphingobacterium pedocola]
MHNEQKTVKRVVVKVGTNVITNKDKRIDGTILNKLVEQIAELYEQDILTVLVSSGSVIAGKEVMRHQLQTADKIIRRQVFSAIGQPRMMRHYYTLFQSHGMRCAQVLATKRDFDTGKHRENMINCYEGLLREGVIPVANEDDAVSLSMSTFTDNDELASLVAELIQADMLILLTDADGFFNGHPRDPDSELIRQITVDETVEQFVQENIKDEAEGRGGMRSKLQIAKKTAKMNIPTYIANGKTNNVILDIVAGKDVGTRFTI